MFSMKDTKATLFSEEKKKVTVSQGDVEGLPAMSKQNQSSGYPYLYKVI